MARSSVRSPSAQPAVSPSPPLRKSKSKKQLAAVRRPNDYSSDGVNDSDIFLLPGSDFQILLGVTFLAAVVRLFRIYQPTSVVFDEVQYVSLKMVSLVTYRLLLTALFPRLNQLRWFRIQIHQGQVLYGRPPTPGKNAAGPGWLAGWL